MAAPINRIVTEVLALPKTSRAFLAEKLLESLDEDEDFEITPAWREELERRCAEVDRGEVELIDGETVFREMRGLIK